MQLADARIIVIDDHVDLVENLREILEEEGARVMTASSAGEGLRLAEQPFEVALVDVRLPDARGPFLVPKLKSGDGLQEILLVTGHASIQDAIEAVKAGAYAYVLKPFDPEELIQTVQRALAQVRLRRKAATLQAALERSEAALRTMVDTVQALLLVLDENCRVLQLNQAVVTATGRSAEEILGADWVESFVPPRDQQVVRSACARVREGRDGVGLQSSVLRREPNGTLTERAVSWRLSGLQVEDGFRIYASGLDVTDIRELERRTRLAEKLAAVGTVSAGLAHEIRNPLNAAGLQLQLLERRLAKITDDPKVMEPAATVKEEIGRLGHLVTDFLTFARPQALNLRELDLRNVVQQVMDLERPVAEERGLELRTSLPETPVVIDADVERLKQVVLNLVRNALDAVPPGGTVSVSVDHYGAGARLVVRDTGPGIPDEIRGRIFEPFFTTKEMGTGLGMAITHSLVDLHGGSIEVDNDHGAIFTITLPRHPPRPI